jgi:hypothetical protein
MRVAVSCLLSLRLVGDRVLEVWSSSAPEPGARALQIRILGVGDRYLSAIVEGEDLDGLRNILNSHGG